MNIKFYDACVNNDLKLIKSIIKNNAKDFNFNNNEIWDDGLWGACIGGHINIIKFIIKNSNENQFINLYWNRGLRGACNGGHINIVKLCIKNGANDWNVGLMVACQGGHLNIIKLMIKYGGKLNYGLDGACYGRDLNIINLMIKLGATNLEWAFSYGCYYGDLNIVKYLIKKLKKEKKLPLRFYHYIIHMLSPIYPEYSKETNKIKNYYKIIINAYEKLKIFNILPKWIWYDIYNNHTKMDIV